MNKHDKQLETGLNQLGKELKQRRNKQFKADLRNELIAKANLAEAKNTSKAPKKAKKTFNLSALFNQFFARLVPATAVALVLTIAIYSAGPFLKPGISNELVNVAAAYNYYTIEPINTGATGVNPSSSFSIKSKIEITESSLQKALTVSPETPFDTKVVSATEIEIIPQSELEKGAVYTFSLDGSKIPGSEFEREFKWAYQISDDVNIQSTLPANGNTTAPINTPIEITLNYRGANVDTFKENFSITPQVQGEFEVIGKNLVFKPQGLTPYTTYKATLNKAFNIDQNSLKEDYTFNFKTTNENRGSTTMRFRTGITEASTTKEAEIPISYYNREELKQASTVNINVYKYADDTSYKKDFITEKISTYDELSALNIHPGQKVLELSDVPIQQTAGLGDYITMPQTLSQGYYLVEAKKDEITTYSFLQISNTAVYFMHTTTDTIVWVHDVNSGEPIKNAQVEITPLSIKTTTNDKGIAIIENADAMIKTAKDPILKITTDNVNTYYSLTGGNSSYNPYNDMYNFWSYLNTDRSVYHPNDTMHYFGFIKEKKDTHLENLKLTISNNTGFEEVQELTLTDAGTYAGSVDLKLLGAGYYTINIFNNDNIVASQYFMVEDFIKPEFKFTTDVNSTVLFDGETFNVDVQTHFFDGTPLAHGTVQLYEGGNTYTTQSDSKGNAFLSATVNANNKCDEDSCSNISYKNASITPVGEQWGQVQKYFSLRVIRSQVEATEFDVSHDGISFTTRFIDKEKLENYDSNYYSDIAPNTNTRIKLFEIEEIKSENGTYYDPISKSIQTSYKYTPKYIPLSAKVVQSNANGIATYTPELDPNKKYRADITVFAPNGNSYITRQTIGELNRDSRISYGKSSTIWIYDINDPESNGCYYCDTKKYKVGEKISTKLFIESDETLKEDSTYKYLYILNYDDKYAYYVSTKPTFEFEFEEAMVPNVTLNAMIFDGEKLRRAYNKVFTYNYDEKLLDVEISKDQEKYEPGEDATITVSVKDDTTGAPTANAEVNIKLVDEAYYELYSESIVNPLEQIYKLIPNGILNTYASHKYNQVFNDGGKGGCFIGSTHILMADYSVKPIEEIAIGDMILTKKHEFSDELVAAKVVKTYKHTVDGYLLLNEEVGVTKEHIVFVNGKWIQAGEIKIGDIMTNSKNEPVTITSIEEVYKETDVYNFEVEKYHTYFAEDLYVHNDKGGVRDSFADTAAFVQLTTDNNGQATTTIELPDNLTSWRATVEVIESDKLKAGIGNAQVKVSKDVFVSPVMNAVYLEGDSPQIPVRIFGDNITEQSELKLSAKSEELSLDTNVNVAPFNTSYISLGQLSEGLFNLTTYVDMLGFTSNANDEFDDAIKQSFEVVKTRIKATKTYSQVVTENTQLEGSKTERTQVRLMNKKTANLYKDLIKNVYAEGDRSDQLVAKKVSAELLNKYFDENFNETLKPLNEYVSNNGISILPHSSENAELTIKLNAIHKSVLNANSLQRFYENIINSENTLTEKIMAYYGLTLLDQTVLTELMYIENTYELSTEDKIYLGLAYAETGAIEQATGLLVDVLSSASKNYKGTTYIELTNANDEETIKATLMTATLALKVESHLHQALYDFATLKENEIENLNDYLQIEKLLYAKNRLKIETDLKATIKVNGDKITLKNNEIKQYELTPNELANLTFADINGEVEAVVIYSDAVTQTAQSDAIKVSRRYLVNGQETTVFTPGQTVTVELNATINTPGSYLITDYLPSGLQIEGGYNANVKETAATKTIYFGCAEKNFQNCRYNTYTYSARVINKGTFITEPTLTQEYQKGTLMLHGERSTIEIK